MGRVLKAPGEDRAVGPAREAGPRAGPAGPEAEARHVVEAARLEAGRLRAEAAAEGRREGLLAAEGARQEILALRARIVDEAGDEIVDLALAVAGKVLALAVEDPRAAAESARKALARARRPGPAVLHAHPGDLAAVQDLASGSGEIGPGGGPLAVVADLTVDRGGAVVESGTGVVDARIGVQLEAIGAALRREP